MVTKLMNHLGNVNQNTMRYYFTSTRIGKIKSVGEEMEKLEPLYIASGIMKWYNHFWKTVPKMLNRVII